MKVANKKKSIYFDYFLKFDSKYMIYNYNDILTYMQNFFRGNTRRD